MKAIDLKDQLKDYKAGWVVLSKEHKVIESAKNFSVICKKVENHPNKEELLIVSASDNYFGFIT